MLKSLLFILLIGCGSTPSKHKVVEKAEHFVSPGGSIDVEILVEKDSKNQIHPNSYFGKVVLKPGAVIPEHDHSGSDEFLYFTKGAGELTIGTEKIKIKNDMTIFIPKGIKHSYVNTDKKKSAHAMQVYTPAGPEQRFKKWKDDL